MGWKPFSQRNQPDPQIIGHELTRRARNRILALFDEISHNSNRSAPHHVANALDFARRRALLADGGLAVPESYYRLYTTPEALAIAHFLATDTSRAIDFLEWMFRYEFSVGYIQVVDINEILRSEGIGIEFSPYVAKTIDTPAGKRQTSEVALYPEATRKTDEVIHHEVVMPALSILSRAGFEAANAHMLKAHEHYRKGNRREAVTECLSALETTMKVICQAKGWEYKQDQDPLGRLVDVLESRGLIFDFHAKLLKHTGTVRNRVGAHGTEPTPTYTPTDDHVEHMIHITSSHILLLVKLAKL